jgi:hypothetical protein
MPCVTSAESSKYDLLLQSTTYHLTDSGHAALLSTMTIEPIHLTVLHHLIIAAYKAVY